MLLKLSLILLTNLKKIQIGQCDITLDCNQTLEIEINNEWTEYMISLKDFESLGIDMSSITSSIIIKANSGVDIGISNIRLEYFDIRFYKIKFINLTKNLTNV